MGLSAWIGLFAASIMTTLYYIAIYPPWLVFKARLLAGEVPWAAATMVTFVARLQWIMDWGPLFFVVIALFWAFVSPSREEGMTWRG